MKIALIGYGKMGKEIEKIALGRGHEIVSIIDVDGEYVLIRDILGEEIRLQGNIKMVDLANSIVELDCE